MSLFIAMFPFYVLGNFHCLGMCGPLAMTLSAHRFRYFYFWGRLLSFTLAGALAGEVGSVLNVIFNYYHLSAGVSFLFGLLILLGGIFGLLKRPLPGQYLFTRVMGRAQTSFSLLILRDRPLATFLFGFLTITLPCGQSMVVFSACALSGSLLVGMFNGFAFALITSPALFFAMRAHHFLKGGKKYYSTAVNTIAVVVGVISLCRGAAELDVIPHLAISLPLTHAYHLVIF